MSPWKAPSRVLSQNVFLRGSAHFRGNSPTLSRQRSVTLVFLGRDSALEKVYPLLQGLKLRLQLWYCRIRRGGYGGAALEPLCQGARKWSENSNNDPSESKEEGNLDEVFHDLAPA